MSVTTTIHTQTRYTMTSRVLLHYQHTNDYCRLLTLTYMFLCRMEFFVGSNPRCNRSPNRRWRRRKKRCESTALAKFEGSVAAASQQRRSGGERSSGKRFADEAVESKCDRETRKTRTRATGVKGGGVVVWKVHLLSIYYTVRPFINLIK